MSDIKQFPGYRLMVLGETIRKGDMVKKKYDGLLMESVCVGWDIEADDIGDYYTPITASPVTDSEALAASLVEVLQAENQRLKDALAYMADEANWGSDEDCHLLLRPGGFRQEGIIMYSAHVTPRAFAASALGGQDGK